MSIHIMKKASSRSYSPQTITDTEFADDKALQANSLEEAALAFMLMQKKKRSISVLIKKKTSPH